MAEQQPIESTQLNDLVQELLEKARAAGSQRAAHMIYGASTTVLSQTLLALAAGAELAEHDAPPEATLQVLTGQLTLHGQGRHWDLSAGDYVEIPQERHSVTATADSVFLLSTIRDMG